MGHPREKAPATVRGRYTEQTDLKIGHYRIDP